MDLRELSAEEQGLVQAFTEMARAECQGSNWPDVEAALLSYWNKTYRGHLALRWDDLIPIIRAACGQAG